MRFNCTSIGARPFVGQLGRLRVLHEVDVDWQQVTGIPIPQSFDYPGITLHNVLQHVVRQFNFLGLDVPDAALRIHHGKGFEKDAFATAEQGTPWVTGFVIDFHCNLFCKNYYHRLCPQGLGEGEIRLFQWRPGLSSDSLQTSHLMGCDINVVPCQGWVTREKKMRRRAPNCNVLILSSL